MKGKAFIVTGGGQGIGRRTALTLAERGAAVCVADVNDERGRNVCREIADGGGRGLYVHCNVAAADDCKRAVAETVKSFGGLNGVVNNASIFSTIKMKPFWEIEEAEWDELMAVNLRGTWQMSKAALASLLAAPPTTSIVNISSSTALFGRPNYAHYVSSKAGVVGLSRAMARELGAKSVRVNSILPGPIFTEIPRSTVTEEQKRVLIANQCLNRLGTAEDIANVVAFLLSDESSFITGQIFNVDGGYVMH